MPMGRFVWRDIAVPSEGTTSRFTSDAIEASPFGADPLYDAVVARVALVAPPLRVALDFIALIIAKLTNDAVSFRFLLFCLVGLTGIAIHMATLQFALGVMALGFGAAQTVATVAAITWNFVLNNMFTYRDQRLAGVQFVTGLIRFQLICAVGAISNVGIASVIYERDPNWWVAGLGGALMGAVWNYVVSAAFVWRQR